MTSMQEPSIRHLCEMTKTQERIPGDLFLDRYMPTAGEEEREAARERLCSLVRILVAIDERLVRKDGENVIRANPGGAVDSNNPAL